MQNVGKKQSFTRDCAFLALTRLIQQKPISDISITELTRKAGISRTAFYKNYASVEDVLVKYFDNCSLGLISEASDHSKIDRTTTSAKKFISGYFDWLSENEVWMKTLISMDCRNVFHNWLRENFHGKLRTYVNRFGFYSNFEISAYVGIFYEITCDWLTGSMDSKSRKRAEGALCHLLYVYQQAADKTSVHFTAPQAIGKLKQYNGIGDFCWLDSGESVRMYVLIEHDQIVNCSAEIHTTADKEVVLKAVSNATCAFVCGKPTVAALSITPEDIAHELYGLSDEFMYFAALSSSAVKNASIDYYNRLALARSLVGEEITPTIESVE